MLKRKKNGTKEQYLHKIEIKRLEKMADFTKNISNIWFCDQPTIVNKYFYPSDVTLTLEKYEKNKKYAYDCYSFLDNDNDMLKFIEQYCDYNNYFKSIKETTSLCNLIQIIISTLNIQIWKKIL